MRFISRIILRIAGWRLEGGIPTDVKKCVLIGVPHTSNWDFYYGRLALYVWGVPLRYLIKKELFVFPLNILFRATGGIPVDRSESKNMVDAMVQLFEKYDRLVLMLAPEGTRSRVDRWRSGFYHVAVKANLPIMPGTIDYGKKLGIIGDPFYPTGDLEKDFKWFEKYYEDIVPKIPKNFNREFLASEKES